MTAAAEQMEELGEITGRLPADPWNDLYERFLLLATESGRAAGMAKARDFYFRRTGDVQTDDRDYELRISLFLDWFAFSWKDGDIPTPAERVFATAGPEILQMARQRHSLFEFLGEKKGVLRLKDLVANEKLDVHPPASALYLTKEELFEARLLETADGHHLAGPVCLHPGGARKAVTRAAKRVRKEAKKDLAARARGAEDLLLELRELRVRSRQFSHIEPARIYSEGLEKFWREGAPSPTS